MSKKQKNPSGFDDLLSTIYSNSEGSEGVSDLDTDITPDPVEDDEKKDQPDNTEGVSEDDKVDEDIVIKDDDSDIPEDIDKTSTKDDKDGLDNTDVRASEHTDSELSDEEVTEATQIGLLFNAVGESLGWNMADINENDRPLTVDDLTSYLSKVVQQNSVPQYADDRIQQLDQYVKNGGNFEDFYSVQKEQISLDGIDIENENNQKQVISELLKQNGYTDEQITNKISRYEDADMLYEESQDALEHLKAIRKTQAEEDARLQQEYAQQQQEEQKQFFDTVSQQINSLNSIRGINVPAEDRKALYNYIFKVDADGQSQYQKDFNKDLSKNLIESAYFTMKGDSLIKVAEKTGETSATEKLRKLLRHQTKNHSTYNVQEKQKSATDLVAGLF